MSSYYPVYIFDMEFRTWRELRELLDATEDWKRLGKVLSRGCLRTLNISHYGGWPIKIRYGLAGMGPAE